MAKDRPTVVKHYDDRDPDFHYSPWIHHRMVRMPTGHPDLFEPLYELQGSVDMRRWTFLSGNYFHTLKGIVKKLRKTST